MFVCIERFVEPAHKRIVYQRNRIPGTDIVADAGFGAKWCRRLHKQAEHDTLVCARKLASVSVPMASVCSPTNFPATTT